MNDEIDGFAEQLKIDMHIDIYNLIEESRNVPNILQRYTDLLRSETRKFNKVSIKMDELISKKFIYYMSEHNIKFNPSDARRMAEADEQVLKVKKIYIFMLRSNPINTTNSLQNSCGIPRKVIINYNIRTVQINTFC